MCATIKNATGCNTAYHTYFRLVRGEKTSKAWPFPVHMASRCVWSVHWGAARCTPESTLGYPPCPTPPAPLAPPTPISPRPSTPPHIPPPSQPPAAPPAHSWHGLSVTSTIAVAVAVALLACALVAFIWRYSIARRRLAQLAGEKQRVNYELSMAMSVATPRAALLDDQRDAEQRCAARLSTPLALLDDQPYAVPRYSVPLRPSAQRPAARLSSPLLDDPPCAVPCRIAATATASTASTASVANPCIDGNLASRGRALSEALPPATRARELAGGGGGRPGGWAAGRARLLWDSDSSTSSTSGRRSALSDASAEDPHPADAGHLQRASSSASPVGCPLLHSCGSANHRSPGSSEVSTGLSTQGEGNGTASCAAPSTAARDPHSRDPPPVLHSRAPTSGLTVSELMSAMRSASAPPSSSLNEEVSALTTKR
jgi:hypothetical protein